MSRQSRPRKFYGLARALEEFEQETWGTNSMPEIQEKIREEEWKKRQDALNGMEEEQADWDADE